MIKVFMANRPPLKEYEQQAEFSTMAVGEIHSIAAQTGNHWRKIFNVYAKFIYSLGINNNDSDVLTYETWQKYRDERLLQSGSKTELHCDHSDLKQSFLVDEPATVRIVMGKGYAESLLENIELNWVDKDFAINKELAIIVCPYFDYRQLSNVKIAALIKLVVSLQ